MRILKEEYLLRIDNLDHTRLELNEKIQELEEVIQSLEGKINGLEVDLEAAKYNIEMIQKICNENKTAWRLAEEEVQGVQEEALQANRLLAIAKNKYQQTEDAYQIAVDRKAQL